MTRCLPLLLLLALAACREPAPAEPWMRLREPLPAALELPGEGPALVALWGSWCPPCLEETPSLRALARNGPGGLQLVVVAVGEDGTAAAEAFGPATPILPDPESAIAQSLRAGVLPVAFLVADGRLVARFDGKRDWSSPSMRQTLARLVEGEQRPAVDGSNGGR